MTSNKRTRSFRILVVDDNAAIHEDFRKILVKAKHRSGDLQSMEAFLFGAANRSTISADDFEMDCAFQGKDALELVRQAVPGAKAPLWGFSFARPGGRPEELSLAVAGWDSRVQGLKRLRPGMALHDRGAASRPGIMRRLLAAAGLPARPAQ